jgi:hypothetical protein
MYFLGKAPKPITFIFSKGIRVKLMEIFSRKEWEFLDNPDKFSDKDKKDLRSLLRKKARDMEWALMFMESCPKAMRPTRDYATMWQDEKSLALYDMFGIAFYEVANTPEHGKLYNETRELLKRIRDRVDEYDEWYRVKYHYWVKVIALRDKLKKSNQLPDPQGRAGVHAVQQNF